MSSDDGASAALPDSTIYTPASWFHPLPVEQMFSVSQPIEVDVGCGKGRFVVARAQAFPGVNFLGIDRLLVRLRKVDKKIARAGLSNVRLLRIEADYAIEHLLPPNSVAGFYIFFPDPWPKRRHHHRRLFSPAFVQALHRALLSGGCVHMATDHIEYADSVRRLFSQDSGFAPIAPLQLTEPERTDFELQFAAQNTPIARCSFQKLHGRQTTSGWPASGAPLPPPRATEPTGEGTGSGSRVLAAPAAAQPMMKP